jgi:hypothetical protein
MASSVRVRVPVARRHSSRALGFSFITNTMFNFLKKNPKPDFQHFTLLADCDVGDLSHDFDCPKGKAIVGLSTWSTSSEESVDLLRAVGERVGFAVTGEIKIYKTKPKEPMRDKAYAYGITFSHYKPDA